MRLALLLAGTLALAGCSQAQMEAFNAFLDAPALWAQPRLAIATPGHYASEAYPPLPGRAAPRSDEFQQWLNDDPGGHAEAAAKASIHMQGAPPAGCEVHQWREEDRRWECLVP